MTALAASAQRGKWVARRRIFRRWLGWVAWSILLPVIGLVTVISTLAGLVFWQYMGHDAAYVATQQWVQQEFGKFQTNSFQESKNIQPQASKDDNATNFNSNAEVKTDLHLDRNLTIKTTP